MAEKKKAYINECRLSGKVMRPEMRSSANGVTWCTFDLFQSRYQGPGRAAKPSYHHCICWNEVAEEFMRKIVVGDMVLISGQYWQENYKGIDGANKQKFQFTVRSFELHKRAADPPAQSNQDTNNDIPF